MRIILFICLQYCFIITNVFAEDRYFDLLKFLETKNEPVLLAEIVSYTVFEITDPYFRGYKYYPALCIKVIKSYNSTLLNKDSIIILPLIQSNTERLCDTFTFYNDFQDKIQFNKKIIITIFNSPYYGTYIIGDTGIAFYVDKEPGKSLYKYLEKKYRKKK